MAEPTRRASLYVRFDLEIYDEFDIDELDTVFLSVSKLNYLGMAVAQFANGLPFNDEDGNAVAYPPIRIVNHETIDVQRGPDITPDNP